MFKPPNTLPISSTHPSVMFIKSVIINLHRTDRNTVRDVTINGLFIPKDMTVGIGIAALHYDPEIWPEPHKYNPERLVEQSSSHVWALLRFCPYDDV